MDDDYDYNADTMGDYDDDWLYVEDDFALSDELAEGQVASPGYAGTNYDIAMESYEFELYAFWDDLEYADDAYWENESPGAAIKNGSAMIQKRKRSAANAKSSPEKRRKTRSTSSDAHSAGQDIAPVLFRSRKERDDRFLASPPALERTEPLAFLSDWRERFANVGGQLSLGPMPEEMKEAAEGDVDSASSDSAEMVAMQGIAGDINSDMADIDPDMLKTILRLKLGDAGLSDMDEGVLMQIITQMLSGDGAADEATGHFANSLLDKVVGEDGDERLTGWLSQQGVSFGDEDSPADSAVDPTNPSNPNHGHSSRKRKALPESEGSAKRPKTKTQSDALRRESKAVREAMDTQADLSSPPGTEAISVADGALGTAADGSLTGEVQPGSNLRKRKAPEPDTHATRPTELRNIRQHIEGRDEPAAEPSPVSRRTRSARTRRK